MNPNLRLEKRTGHEIASLFLPLAQLRIEVFREFPYLYDGTLDYEMSYLQTYAVAARAALFAVYDEDKMVGATTCIPLSDETEEVQKPFLEGGYEVSRIFYFGESILLPVYRGQGIGGRFFDLREGHARSFSSYDLTCFCAVVRPEDHPLKPPQYEPLDAFWLKRGFQKEPRLQAWFHWPDLGSDVSTAKPMVYWTKTLNP
jgi:GNAT superfamily N-acetyltransferase